MPAEAGSSSIWVYAFGYFAAYVPYALLTKLLTSRLTWLEHPVDGLALLPLATTVSAVGVLVFLLSTKLYRRASHRLVWGSSIPVPCLRATLSGACAALIVITTTMAYTFESASIVTMMLLMRGGVLALAPIVDLGSGRRVRWFSWLALALALGGVVASVFESGHLSTPGLWPSLDAAVYLAAYFVRLRAMSGAAKRDRETNLRFFVEEQLVTMPAALVLLACVAWLGPNPASRILREEAPRLLTSPAMPWIVLIGLCSQGTGIFGALVLLDARENSFSVPVNRASSVLAGVVATAVAAAFFGGVRLGVGESIGAFLVLLAIVLLATRSTRSQDPRARA
jgi:drug/metabolite transporter (DMT)-like permease